MQIESRMLEAGERFPNNPNLPLLVYRQVVSGGEPDIAESLDRHFRESGWSGCWQNGVLDYHHFHSNAHEVLGVARGNARLQFGGPGGPVLAVDAGDVAILPAGTGHRRAEATADFLVVGAYPAGQEAYDLLRGDPSERAAAEERIAAVSFPERDPIYGASGGLHEHWKWP